MFSFFKKLFGSKKAAYAEQKKRLESGDPALLMQLAVSRDTNPEILYFLAKKGDDATRRAVALNPSTPVQASTLLAMDGSGDVRLALAGRLVELLPDLSAERYSQLYAYAVQALGMLAQDEVMKVRKALATTLRDYAKAPPAVVSRLARDVEREISEPMLRFCIALADEDIFDILRGHPDSWVVQAIAQRPLVGPEVSQAIVDTDDVPGVALLLANEGASIDGATLEKIVDRARYYPEWHKPVALRRELSVEQTRKLAGYVNITILEILRERSDFDAPTRQAVAAIVARRIEYQREGAEKETPAQKIERYVLEKKLSPDVLLDALSWQEIDFAMLALAHMSGVPLATVRRMLTMGTARPVVALCWKAGISPRMCVDIQRLAGKLQPRDLMYPKGGTDYPLTPAEIRWQLEFFGVSR